MRIFLARPVSPPPHRCWPTNVYDKKKQYFDGECGDFVIIFVQPVYRNGVGFPDRREVVDRSKGIGLTKNGVHFRRVDAIPDGVSVVNRDRVELHL